MSKLIYYYHITNKHIIDNIIMYLFFKYNKRYNYSDIIIYSNFEQYKIQFKNNIDIKLSIREYNKFIRKQKLKNII